MTYLIECFVRYYAPVGAGCISQENVGIGSQGDIKNDNTDIQTNEKAKLERMFLMMEKVRKEELEKLAVEKWDKKVEEEVDKINTGAVRKKTASSSEVRPVSVVNIGMIEDDVFTRFIFYKKQFYKKVRLKKSEN